MHCFRIQNVFLICVQVPIRDFDFRESLLNSRRGNDRYSSCCGCSADISRRSNDPPLLKFEPEEQAMLKSRRHQKVNNLAMVSLRRFSTPSYQTPQRDAPVIATPVRPNYRDTVYKTIHI